MKRVLHKGYGLMLAVMIILAPLSVMANSKDYTRIRGEILEVFETYINKIEVFEKSLETDLNSQEKSKIRRELEEYGETRYRDALYRMKEVLCQTDDHKLLLEFYEVLRRSQNSAYEEPYYVLGDIYTCNSQLVISVTEQADDETRKAIDFNFVYEIILSKKVSKEKIELFKQRILNEG
jgi:t-SNARE complex subunit (syntaxin)